jgi:hypothetical protein
MHAATDTIVVARTNKTFLEFCEVPHDHAVGLPRRRRLSSSLRRVATDPDLLAIDEQQQLPYISPLANAPAPAPRRRDLPHKVFVGGLSPSTDEGTLFNFMTRFGPVRNVTVKRHPVTGMSRRYAFVKFYHAPTSWIFDQTWIVDNQPIRVTRYEVSADWKNHFYSDED